MRTLRMLNQRHPLNRRPRRSVYRFCSFAGLRREIPFVAIFFSLLLPQSLLAREKDPGELCGEVYASTAKENRDQGITKITSIVAENMRSWRCFYYRAALYRDRGDLEKALHDSIEAISLAPKEVDPYVLRAGLHVISGDWAQALADCDTVLHKQRTENCVRYRAIALYWEQRFPEALQALDDALRLKDNDATWRGSLYKLRGGSLFKVGRYGEAIDSLNLAETLEQMDDNAYFLRGVAEWKLGQLEKANSDATIVLEKAPRLQIRFNGDRLLDMFDLDKRKAAAVKAADAAQTAANKGDLPAAFESWNTAYSYGSSFMQDGDATMKKILEGVVTSYASLALKPDLPELARRFNVQAETYLQDKNYSKAIEAYGRTISVTPWYPQAYFNLALLEGDQQQYKAAISHMGTYLKLVPGATDARAAQDKIYAWQAKTK